MADAINAMPDASLPVVPSDYECDVQQAGTVRVHTNSPNVTVLVHDVFGSFVSRTTTAPKLGGGGSADLVVPGCGAVTAIRSSLYHTITYVRGGDNLWLESLPDFPASGAGTARLYIDNFLPNVTSYPIVGPLRSGLVANDPAARDLFWNDRSLNDDGLTTFVVHGQDSMGQPDVHNYSVFENISLSAAIQTPLRLTTWSTQTTTYQLQIQLAMAAQVIDAVAVNWTNERTYWPLHANANVPSTSHEFSFELSDYGEGLVVGALFLSAAGDRTRSYEKAMLKPSMPTISLDLTQELLPEIESIAIASSATRPTFSWVSGPPTGVTPDLAVFRMYGPVEWRVALPPGATSLQLPELPADLAHDFSAVSSFGLMMHEASDYPGYAVARARFAETFYGGRKYPMGVVLRNSKVGSSL